LLGHAGVANRERHLVRVTLDGGDVFVGERANLPSVHGQDPNYRGSEAQRMGKDGMNR